MEPKMLALILIYLAFGILNFAIIECVYNELERFQHILKTYGIFAGILFVLSTVIFWPIYMFRYTTSQMLLMIYIVFYIWIFKSSTANAEIVEKCIARDTIVYNDDLQIIDRIAYGAQVPCKIKIFDTVTYCDAKGTLNFNGIEITKTSWVECEKL